MAGKASGRCRGAEGVYGRFRPGFDGYRAAVSWRDGQTTPDPHTRDEWLIVERAGYTWCLPPSLAQRALADETWTPEWPFDLLPMAEKERLIAEAAAAGLPAPGHLPPLGALLAKR